MFFNFGKCKCLYTGHGNLDVNYKKGDTVLGRGKSLTSTCSLKRPTTALADHSNTMYALCMFKARAKRIVV